MLRELEAFVDRYPFVGFVRRRRAVPRASSWSSDKKTKEPLPRKVTERIFTECVRRGLLTMAYAASFRIQPALTIDEATAQQRPRDPARGVRPRRSRGLVETVSFLEALVRALGRGWSARYGVIAPYGVLGVTLTTDVGGSVEIVPSLVRGDVVVWSPFVFTTGTPHYDLYTDDGQLTRTRVLADAVARLERWRRARAPGGRVAARLARVGAGRRRGVRTTELDLPRIARGESLADALRGKALGETRRARELAADRDRTAAAGELLAIARRSTGDARANALGVLVAIAAARARPRVSRATWPTPSAASSGSRSTASSAPATPRRSRRSPRSCSAATASRPARGPGSPPRRRPR